MNTRKEFIRVMQPERFTSDAEGLMWESWQVAASSTAAKYELRIKELEGYLYQLKSIVPESFVVAQNTIAEALSTTSPEKALQRDRLKTRLDEHNLLNQLSHERDMVEREEQLRAELAALEGEKT